jgi:hypothetical protein
MGEDNNMMRSCLSSFAGLFALVVPVLLSVSITAAQEDTTGEPGIIVVTSEPFEMTFGSGPFDLLSPTIGLSDLSSYRATLTVSFAGAEMGQRLEWTRAYTLLVSQDPPAHQLTIDASDDPDGQVTRAAVNRTLYEWREDGSCIAAIEAGEVPAELSEPASFLDSVIGAQEAASESVNDIPSDYYTFDESTLGASGIAESIGELWVASDGGYLVRYTLETTGGADYFGEDIEGTLTWDYQLDSIGVPLVIELPDNCPPGLLNLPMLPDAADVLEFPGMTSYTTTANLEDTLTFYQERVSELGGQAANPPLVMESSALFGFTLDDQPILLVAASDLAGIIIELYQVSDPDQLGLTAAVPNEGGAQPEPTEAASTMAACEPGTSSVPVTLDATSMQDMGMALSYMTKMSLTDVAAFYEEQLAALGAQVSSPVPASDFMAMLNVTQNNQSYAIMISPMGTTTNVTISSLTGQMTSFTPCTAGAAPSTATVVSPDTAPTESASDNCPRGVLPLLPDAANIQEIPALGAVSYTTSTSVLETVAFYEEQFAALGAQAVPQMPATEAMASPMFMLSDLPIVLTITAQGDGSTSVSITIMGSNPFRGAAPCG